VEEKLSQLYGMIGNQIASMIPTEWKIAYLLGEIEKGAASQSVSLYYVESESNNTINYNALAENMDDFIKNYDPI